MRNLFRSRRPRQLTLSQITKLSAQSTFSPAEVEKWYERFIRCYTSGYVSFGEFQTYIRQLALPSGNRLSRSLMHEIFSILDLNKDHELNFEEFFRFNLLVNQGSMEEKLKFIFNLYRRARGSYFTQPEILALLTTMFNILDMSKLTEKLSEKIDQILKYTNLHDRICWNTFCISILNQTMLFELLLSNRLDENIIARF